MQQRRRERVIYRSQLLGNHLRVWRSDGKSGISWDRLQQIKNEMAGEESFAVEFYPPAREVVNDVNMRHLWIIPRETLPFGLR